MPRERVRFEHELATLAAAEMSAVAPAIKCVAEAYDAIAKARSLDGPAVSQTKSAYPLLHAAYIFLKGAGEAYRDSRVAWAGFARGFRNAKEKELGQTLIAHALETLSTVRAKAWFGATIGGYWPLLDTTTAAARYFFELGSGEGVSAELKDAPAYRPELTPTSKLNLQPNEVRVVLWLRRYRRYLREYAKRFTVTPVAIAGAIAWEALENPMFFTVSSVGPGKIHTRTSPIPLLGSDRTLARQIEEANYLPKQSEAGRERLLKSPQGAILYVAAMMGAAADIAKTAGFEIRFNPGVLTTFYQGHDLASWKAHMQRKKARGDTTFNIEDTMATWVESHLKMLTLGTGAITASTHP